jgi:hypothetical protein
MSMAMENLAIARYKDTLRYACIRSGAYKLQLQRFKVGDYVYPQCEAPTALDIWIGRTILRVKAILPSGVLLLKDKDGQESRDNTKNYIPYHLPIEKAVHLKLAVIPPRYKFLVCGESKDTTT